MCRYVYNKIINFQCFDNFSNFSAFTLKKNLQFCLQSFHIWHKSSLASDGVSHVMTFGLDLHFQGHSALTLKNRVRSVASTVLGGFFPYSVQMITSMRRCVACDDLWPWPISSRLFDLVLTWDPTWRNSVGNHEAAGVFSERRRSNCSSYHLGIENSTKHTTEPLPR